MAHSVFVAQTSSPRKQLSSKKCTKKGGHKKSAAKSKNSSIEGGEMSVFWANFRTEGRYHITHTPNIHRKAFFLLSKSGVCSFISREKIAVSTEKTFFFPTGQLLTVTIVCNTIVKVENKGRTDSDDQLKHDEKSLASSEQAEEKKMTINVLACHDRPKCRWVNHFIIYETFPF
jgi:hypothetical protein